MVNLKSFTVAATLLVASASAYDIPANLKRLYDAHKPGKCQNKIKGGYTPGVGGSDTSFAYCGDINGTIFLHSERNGGQYADMDVDCDGLNRSAGDCKNDPTGQGQTAFMDELKKSYGIPDLDANLHSYVVFGNDNYDPSKTGGKAGAMKPLSVMAIICNNQLHYGIWGDTNGAKSVGEASLALAQTCFPKDHLTGDNGHGEFDVMYIGFTGPGTLPTDANWKAKTRAEFTASLKARGDRLVATLGG